jgi:hypothetical protein
MNQHIKFRARRRQKSEGAIIFIVATTLALLAAMGVYALTNTTAEIRTAGYQRQALQAHYVTNVATIGAVEAFSPDNVSYIDNQMRTTQPATPCLSAPPAGMTTGTAAGFGTGNVSDIARRCVKLHPNYITQVVGNGTALFPTNQMKEPSHSSTFMEGSFVTEVTEPLSTGVKAGFDTNNGKCFYRYTLTSYGRLAKPPADGSTLLGQEASRARVVVGPLDCGG